MTNAVTNIVEVIMPHFEGYAYPNEATQQPLWSVLIVLYPYITGLVAGAFIMASLVRVFNVKALEPVRDAWLDKFNSKPGQTNAWDWDSMIKAGELTNLNTEPKLRPEAFPDNFMVSCVGTKVMVVGG